LQLSVGKLQLIAQSGALTTFFNPQMPLQWRI